MDGVFEGSSDGNGIKIEEIKSAFNIRDLAKRLRDDESHPYCLQLKTYGYIHWLKTGSVPELVLHLVSSRDGSSIDMDLRLDPDEFRLWVDARLAELIHEAKQAEARVLRRKRVALAMAFPFAEPRLGQVELMQQIQTNLQLKQPMLVQAATGLGKTMGVLFPNLREALPRGQRVIYVTPKNSQHAVAEDAVERLQAGLKDEGSKAKLKSLTITAKSKICFKNEALCNPEYCEYAKDHYTKVAQHGVLDVLAKKRKLTARTFRKVAEEFQVCPFEIQLDAAQDADVVICDYNYVFAPRSAFGRLSASGLDQDGKPNLVVDEAHNLPARANDYYSPTLSVTALERMREDLAATKSLRPKRFTKEAESLIDECVKVIKACGEKSGKPKNEKAFVIDPPAETFLAQDEKLRAFLSSYLNSDVDIPPRDTILRLSFYWSEFTAALEFVSGDRSEFFTTYNPEPATIRITCCDASEMLKSAYEEYENVVAFSATLKPFQFYGQLSGLQGRPHKTAEFQSPFPREHRKVLVIPQISSKYSDRERNYPRIAETIRRITEIKRGNYFAFFPSFDFMDRVAPQLGFVAGFDVIRQERSMPKAAIDGVIDRLREPGGAHIVLAVQGGVFSEGVDYPGDMVIGAFIVGPPLPTFDLEREKMREYYQQSYGSGFDYAYTYPAMAKAIQAAGRVIRSETDRGLIVLMDRRFVDPSYAKSMPSDWFDDSPHELVSNQILQDVEAFWTPADR